MSYHVNFYLSAVSERFETPIPLINESGREQNTSPIIIVEKKVIVPGNKVCTFFQLRKIIISSSADETQNQDTPYFVTPMLV